MKTTFERALRSDAEVDILVKLHPRMMIMLGFVARPETQWLNANEGRSSEMAADMSAGLHNMYINCDLAKDVRAVGHTLQP